MDDLAVPQHHRSGAHRARRHPFVAALVTFGAVAVASALLVWALLSLDVLGVGDVLRDAADEVPGPIGSSAPTAEPSPALSAEVTEQAEPEPEPEPSASAPLPLEPTPEPSPDQSLTLDVLNSTQTPGLAAAGAEQLEGLGWTIGEVTNFEGDEITTTVLYPEGTFPVTAEAVAEDLGVGAATASAEVSVITVVLGPDYAE